MNTNAPGTSPDLRIINSVFAIEDVTHNGLQRLALAWANVVESRGNVFLNLSDTPLPANYPMPPEGSPSCRGRPRATIGRRSRRPGSPIMTVSAMWR